jgi:hypothetical protein
MSNRRRLEWLLFRAGKCGIELTKEATSFPHFLNLFQGISNNTNLKARLGTAKDLWKEFSGT